MTTLSDVNIIVQQSGRAKAAQNILHAVQEQSQLAAGQQRVREQAQRSTIQNSEDSKPAQLKKKPDDKESDKRKERRSAKGGGNPPAEDAAVKPRSRGKFVDTVA
ncbi:MAG: hypothetical protein C4530_09660 [Desulfobacteraceae bacterium]|nr:MAG: hypothetical protein C4530_09660 [Desulfobacteraceae bacterium]